MKDYKEIENIWSFTNIIKRGVNYLMSFIVLLLAIITLRMIFIGEYGGWWQMIMGFLVSGLWLFYVYDNIRKDFIKMKEYNRQKQLLDSDILDDEF